MSNSSILGGDTAASHSAGKDVDALGPSDSSDSGSDVQGERAMATRPDLPDELGAIPVDGGSDSDSVGTGERASAEGNDGRDGADILPDRIIDGPEGLADEDLDALGPLDDEPELSANPGGGRNRDVEQLEDHDPDAAERDDVEGVEGDSSDDDSLDPGNTASGRESDRARQVLGGSRSV